MLAVRRRDAGDGGAVSQAHTSGYHYQHPPLRGSPNTQKKPCRCWLDASRAATGSEQGKDGRERLAVGLGRDWRRSSQVGYT